MSRAPVRFSSRRCVALLFSLPSSVTELMESCSCSPRRNKVLKSFVDKSNSNNVKAANRHFLVPKSGYLGGSETGCNSWIIMRLRRRRRARERFGRRFCFTAPRCLARRRSMPYDFRRRASQPRAGRWREGVQLGMRAQRTARSEDARQR